MAPRRRASSLAGDALLDGDLHATTDDRTILAESLEQRCGAGAVTDVLPGVPSSRRGALALRS